MVELRTGELNMNQSERTDNTSKSPSRLTRRGLLMGATAVTVAGGVAAARWFNIYAQNGNADLSPPEVHAAALSGDLLLIDIRRPDEWARTGLGEGAIPLDMRREDFEAALLELVNGDRSRIVAVICARGVRSRRMTELLYGAGFSRIIDVPEGMLGSGAGPGWLKRGLPTIPYAL